MNIKRNIYFALKVRTGSNGEKLEKNLPIRMRVSYNWCYPDFYSGFNIDLCDWDAEGQRVLPNKMNRAGQTAGMINSHLAKMKAAMIDTFTEFEVLDQVPTVEMLSDRYKEKLSGVSTAIKALQPHKPKVDFWKCYHQFIVENSEKRSWTPATIEKFDALRHHIQNYKMTPTFEDFNDSGLTAFIASMHKEKKKLKNGTEIELKNSTIEKQLGYLKWFLKWAVFKGYSDDKSYEVYKPKLKQTQKKIIFLTEEEIQKLVDFKIPAGNENLERVRDVFVFCCYSGLRYSDAYNLRRPDLKKLFMEVTTIKTADSLEIEYNGKSKAILDKYKDANLEDNKVLPVISEQKMNTYLKELCKMAGFDEEIRLTTYKSNERIDTIKKKYELITTHVGRKSFICNCLALGIPVNVVMKWTGHKDYKSMKPYIDVADSIKAREMKKFDKKRR